MGARFLNLFLAFSMVLMVAACADKPGDDGIVTTDSGLTSSDRSAVMSQPESDMMAAPNDGVMSGSQQDLVVNIGDRVFFGYDQYDLTTEARAVVERQAQWLKTYPNVSVIVEGHADERGTREYNIALGEKRATAVRNYLIANGVTPDRLQTISYGKERPAVLGADESSWSQNRRSVLVVQ